ncbi:MAG TPA: hypothetical protein VML96_12590, partial [Egibacteraceae bacterium]|nr:hypothetical protein [Egibacteraceae bacterium]
MTSADQPASGGAAVAERPPRRADDERLARLGLLTRALRRPEIGAIIGAVAVFIFFALASDVFATLSGAARWTDVAS